MVTGVATDTTAVISGAVKLKENRRTIDTVAQVALIDYCLTSGWSLSSE